MHPFCTNFFFFFFLEGCGLAEWAAPVRVTRDGDCRLATSGPLTAHSTRLMGTPSSVFRPLRIVHMAGLYWKICGGVGWRGWVWAWAVKLDQMTTQLGWNVECFMGTVAAVSLSIEGH